MATDIRSLPAFIGGDTEFRTWGAGISDMLGDAGLVMTGDTGQINWTTAVRPATVSFAGYEMWRFADAKQATTPVFIKLEYGVGATVDRPVIRFAVGTATNGAGTLTGVTTTATKSLSTSVSKAAGAMLNTYVCAAPNRLTLCTNFDPAANGSAEVVIVERAKDDNGADIDGMVVVLSSVTSTTAQLTQHLVPGSAPMVYTLTHTIPLAAITLTASGSDVAMSPVFVALGRWYFAWPLSYKQTDLADLTPFTMTHLGASHTFLPMGAGLPSAFGNNLSLAILWE